jgi:hypothetical protein
MITEGIPSRSNWRPGHWQKCEHPPMEESCSHRGERGDGKCLEERWTPTSSEIASPPSSKEMSPPFGSRNEMEKEETEK